MLRSREPSGAYLTARASKYPAGINEELAREMVDMATLALGRSTARLPQSDKPQCWLGHENLPKTERSRNMVKQLESSQTL